MSEAWAISIGSILVLAAYGMISAKLKTRKLRKEREATVPVVSAKLDTGTLYNVVLSDGRRFSDAHLLGTADASAGQFALGGWEGMLILKQATGKRAFIRLASVRLIEEV
jgi:hypothetical protein